MRVCWIPVLHSHLRCPPSRSSTVCETMSRPSARAASCNFHGIDVSRHVSVLGHSLSGHHYPFALFANASSCMILEIQFAAFRSFSWSCEKAVFCMLTVFRLKYSHLVGLLVQVALTVGPPTATQHLLWLCGDTPLDPNCACHDHQGAWCTSCSAGKRLSCSFFSSKITITKLKWRSFFLRPKIHQPACCSTQVMFCIGEFFFSKQQPSLRNFLP